jgi:tetratricopeptide (TPR) repeat protein
MTDLTKAIELDPNFALAYYRRGHTYAVLEKIDKAMADLEKAVTLTTNPQLTARLKREIETLEKGFIPYS